MTGSWHVFATLLMSEECLKWTIELYNLYIAIIITLNWCYQPFYS